jgi:hypothetical protein
MPTPSTYYTQCSPIIPGCRLYLDSGFTIPAPSGYYANGLNVYTVIGSSGVISTIAPCPSTTQGPCSGDCCFTGNTMISLANDEIKTIKNIIPGDEVLSYNETSNQNEIKKVIQVKGKITNDLVRYTFTNGVVLESTPDHPYYVNGYNIASFDPIITTEKYNFDIDIDLIKVGDVVNLADGTTTIIEDIEKIFSNERVYTFEVEGNHNYYANGVLVHNKGFFEICCQNSITGQFSTISNAGDPTHPGCCCLGTEWIDVDPSLCGISPP